MADEPEEGQKKRRPVEDVIVFDGEEYYTPARSIDYLGIARNTFYRNVRNKIKVYNFRGRRTPYYKKSDLDKFNRGEIVIERENRAREQRSDGQQE